MKTNLLLIAGFFLLTNSCDKHQKEVIETMYKATVLGRGMDCGNAFLIQFEEKTYSLPASSKNIYYEINLPEEYKIAGREILIQFHEPRNDEIMVCTAMGPAYPQVVVTKVE